MPHIQAKNVGLGEERLGKTIVPQKQFSPSPFPKKELYTRK